MLINDVKVSISDISDIYSKGGVSKTHFPDWSLSITTILAIGFAVG
jgi:hypothetical protein